MMPLGMPLDGELWMGRGTFQQMNGFLKRKDTAADEWFARQVKFMVFDAPFADGNYETRMAAVKSHLGFSLFVQPVHSEKVTDEAAMRTRARAIAEAGGEGLMLREPHGVYRPDRTCDLLKVVDKLHTEAMVIGHNKGWEEAATDFAGESVRLGVANAALLEFAGEGAGTWAEAFDQNAWRLAHVAQHGLAEPEKECETEFGGDGDGPMPMPA